MQSRVAVPAVEVRQLTRIYPTGRSARRDGNQRVGLAGVDLTIPVGEVHGVLGPNGAGKTTLCKILTTLLTPTSGSAAILGHDVVREAAAVRRSVSLVLGGERGLYYRLTARENLLFWAAVQGLPDREGAHRAGHVLEQVGLAARADDLVQTFSRGMKQRLHLARGLVSDPPVLVLDEPTTGMDPIAMKEFRELVRQIAGGRTILLTTHDMAEAEQLCNRVTMIGDGRVVATESPRTLATWVTRFERIDIGAVDPAILEKVEALPGIGTVTVNQVGDARVETVAAGATVAVLRLLADSNHTNVRVSIPSLEEVYVHLFGAQGAEL